MNGQVGESVGLTLTPRFYETPLLQRSCRSVAVRQHEFAHSCRRLRHDRTLTPEWASDTCLIVIPNGNHGIQTTTGASDFHVLRFVIAPSTTVEPFVPRVNQSRFWAAIKPVETEWVKHRGSRLILDSCSEWRDRHDPLLAIAAPIEAIVAAVSISGIAVIVSVSAGGARSGLKLSRE